MQQYHDLLKGIVSQGEIEFEPRTQLYTIGISAWLSKYDLREGFPIVTTKSVTPRLPFEELFWKLRGERNVKSLVDRNINIWTANAFDRYLRNESLKEKFPKNTSEWDKEFEVYTRRIKEDSEFAATSGDLGPVYGFQWRHWSKKNTLEVDQLSKVLKGIKEQPGSRYHILNAYNVGELEEMALGPCPFWHQFTVYGKNLDLTLVQRSCDTFLGVPFNIAQDSLLLHAVAKETELEPRFFNHQYINTHIYLGSSPRADFWKNNENINEFKDRFNQVSQRSQYENLREWYLSKVSPEKEGSVRKDHMPFVLRQLSFQPKPLARIQLTNKLLLEAIQGNALDYATVLGYDPHKWDAKAAMAA